MGGAARFRNELCRYLTRTQRQDIRVIGLDHHVDVAWLVRREAARAGRGRRVAVNNVGFIASRGERWTLLRNALHFLTDEEAARLAPEIVTANRRKAAIVRLAAHRADVLVVPCTAMAERVAAALPSVADRIVVRPHPVSLHARTSQPQTPVILCPVLFAPYKQMAERIRELLSAVDRQVDPAVALRITAEHAELPHDLATHPRIELVGRLSQADLHALWVKSSAIYYPTGLESFGYPLAEARASGYPVIAQDTPQNREIAGPALCGYVAGDPASLRAAALRALSLRVTPDPAPFDPDAYFDWLLGDAR
jgi:glycosyltransferase involved in cell wall biosynthesis